LSTREGSWAWILQRLTAVLLLALLGAHFFVLHFVPSETYITFSGVAARLQGVLFWVIDFGLLVISLYHGLNGVRAVALDYWPGVDRSLSLALIIIGLVATIYGGRALTVFIRGM